MIETLTAFPATFTAGDTVKVLTADASFPAPEWRVLYSFGGPEMFSKLATASGSSHLLKLGPGDTMGRKPGFYAWNARAELASDPTEATTFARGNVFVVQNAAAGTVSYAANALALIEAHILGRLPSGLMSHNLNGNSIGKIPLPEAEKLRDKYRMEIASLQAAEAAAQGIDAGAIYPVFFTP